jgi:hypothetical protein
MLPRISDKRKLRGLDIEGKRLKEIRALRR